MFIEGIKMVRLLQIRLFSIIALELVFPCVFEFVLACRYYLERALKYKMLIWHVLVIRT